MARDMYSHDKSVATVRWVIQARWIIVIGAFLLILAGRVLGLASGVTLLNDNRIALLISFALVFNVVLWLYMKKKRSHTSRGLQIISILQLVLDQLFYSGAVYVSGGIETQAFMFYTLSIMAAAILFRGWPVVLFGVTAGLMYMNVILLEYFQILPHISRYGFDTGVFGDPLITFVNGIAVMFLLVLVSFYSAFVSIMIRDRESMIASEQEKVSAVFRNFLDGLILFDQNKKVILINPVAEKMFGLPARDVLGRTAGKQHHELRFQVFDDIMSHPVRFNETLRQYEFFEYELTEPQKIFLQVSTVDVADEKGKMWGTMRVLHDVTREKAIDTLKSEFISVAAHQLRTPLSAIKWVIKLVMDGDAGDVSIEQKSMLQKGFESNERMIRLVNDLLNVSRIEEGRFQYKFEIGTIQKMIDSVVEELQPSIRERGVKFSLEYKDKALPQIRFDPSKLRLAVQNLIDNAARYTKLGGSVQVIVGHDTVKKKVCIDVVDTGVGIPKDQQAKLFTKFFRADNVVRMQTDGSGLGLFIVKNIVIKHGGEVTFVSEPGKGTTFTITLPLLESVAEKKGDAFQDFMEQI